jgi:hypothetical protein
MKKLERGTILAPVLLQQDLLQTRATGFAHMQQMYVAMTGPHACLILFHEMDVTEAMLPIHDKVLVRVLRGGLGGESVCRPVDVMPQE